MDEKMVLQVGPRTREMVRALASGKSLPKTPKPRPQHRLAQGKKTDRYVRIRGGTTVYRESTVARWRAEARAHAEFKRLLPARRKRKLPPNSRVKRRNRWWAQPKGAIILHDGWIEYRAPVMKIDWALPEEDS